MAKIIQLRHVPDAFYRRLKARAATDEISLSEYLLRELQQVVQKPTLPEFQKRLHSRNPVSSPIDTALLIRKERGLR